MKNSTKETEVSKRISIRKCVSLGGIPDAEQWLNTLATQGYMLSKIEGRTFYFESTEADLVYFFMLSPEKGANTSAWVFYEFLENGGIRIPHFGDSHLSPNLVLKIPVLKYKENEQLFRYYFLQRNYRLLHRLVSNILLSMALFLLCVGVIFIDYKYMVSLLYICFGSLFIGLHNTIMLFRFLKSCKTQGLPAMWNRPRRPGY